MIVLFLITVLVSPNWKIGNWNPSMVLFLMVFLFATGVYVALCLSVPTKTPVKSAPPASATMSLSSTVLSSTCGLHTLGRGVFGEASTLLAMSTIPSLVTSTVFFAIRFLLAARPGAVQNDSTKIPSVDPLILLCTAPGL